jgi:intracellular multiplication protein IcmT
MLWLLHMKIWTFVVALVAMTFFSLLLRFGFTFFTFLRWARSVIAGRRKAAKPWWV